MERDSFVFYKKWSEAISGLPSEIRLEIYDSIVEYATTGKVSDLKMTAQVGFAFVKADIDRDLKKYLQMIEKNRDNGQKGGRPPKGTITQKNPLGFSETQQNPKNLEYDNDLFIDNDNKISFLEKKKQKTQTHIARESEKKNRQKNSETASEKNQTDDLNDTLPPSAKKRKKVPPKKEKENKPDFSDFLSYAEEIITKNNLGEISLFKFALTAKYNQWEADNWHDGNGRPIRNWKTKLQNTLPYLKPLKPQTNGQSFNTTGTYRPTAAPAGSVSELFANAQASGRKVSSHSILAREFAQQLTRDYPEASQIIDVEVLPE